MVKFTVLNNFKLQNMSEIKIACPKCQWEPPASALWRCSCGHAWHTFDTAAKCPECKKQWKDTACHACSKWSPHLDWYRGLDEALRKELEAIIIREKVNVD